MHLTQAQLTLIQIKISPKAQSNRQALILPNIKHAQPDAVEAPDNLHANTDPPIERLCSNYAHTPWYFHQAILFQLSCLLGWSCGANFHFGLRCTTYMNKVAENLVYTLYILDDLRTDWQSSCVW